jgi:hypothetical protein
VDVLRVECLVRVTRDLTRDARQRPRVGHRASKVKTRAGWAFWSGRANLTRLACNACNANRADTCRARRSDLAGATSDAARADLTGRANDTVLAGRTTHQAEVDPATGCGPHVHIACIQRLVRVAVERTDDARQPTGIGNRASKMKTCPGWAFLAC